MTHDFPGREVRSGAYSYGYTVADDPARLELAMIRRTALGEGPVGGLGVAEHVRRFMLLAWPHCYHHRWNEMIRKEVCRSMRGTTTVWGPASSQKTSTVSFIVLALYWALSDQLTVICSTTTLQMLDLRVWGEIKMRFKEARERYPWLPGNLLESNRRICTDAREENDGRDFRNGILGVACVKSSGEWQGLASYSGVKNKFVILVGDELHVMEQNFLQGVTNLKSNTNFMAIYLGNLVDLETPLGDAGEPSVGWNAFPDSDESRAYDLKALDGRGIQLVGKDSPNFDYSEGIEPFSGLIGRRFIRELKHDYGEGTPMYIAQAGGTIPRSSLANKVITKEVCLKFGAFEPVTWGGGRLTRLYCADLSYTVSHGDRTVGACLEFGQDITGKSRLAYVEDPKVFSIPRLSPGQSVEDCLAVQIKEEMDRLGVPPERFFFDGTGRSSFTAAAMRVMGTAIQPVEFGGTASERPNFVGKKHQEGPDKGTLKPCKEVFGKFVSELWFAWRYVIESGQLRGLPEDTAKEGYMRLWSLGPANKMDVEPKDKMKLRLSRSPDLGDCLVTGIEGARRLGFVIGTALTAGKIRDNSWLRDLKRDYGEELAKMELTYN